MTQMGMMISEKGEDKVTKFILKEDLTLNDLNWFKRIRIRITE